MLVLPILEKVVKERLFQARRSAPKPYNAEARSPKPLNRYPEGEGKKPLNR